MKFALFGSRIIDDAIVKINDSGHHDVNRIVGISPFSANCSFSDNIIKYVGLEEKNEYRRKISLWDLNKTVYKELGEADCKYVCMDFGCGIKPLWEFYFDGGQYFRVTYTDTVKNNIKVIRRELEAAAGKKIQKEKQINPLLWKDNEIEKEIDNLADRLKKEISNKELVLLIPKCAFQYEHKGGIIDCKDYKEIALINDFIDKCSRYFAKKTGCTVINSSEFILGGEMYEEYEGLYYSDEYYEYINQCLRFIDEKNVLSGSDEQTALEAYEKKLQDKIDLMLLPETFKTIEANINGKKLIIIGGSQQYAEKLKHEYQQDVAFLIPYEKAVTNGKLCTELETAIKNKENYACLITYLKPHDNLREMLWQKGKGFSPFKDCNFSSHKSIILQDFKGIYFDVYHNRASVKNSSAKVIMDGFGSNVEMMESNQSPYDIQVYVKNQSQVIVGKNVRADKLKISFVNSCRCTVGNDCSFASNCLLVSCDFMSVELGNDCMFSNNIVVHAGDGHAVFDAETGNRINYDIEKGLSKFQIKLHDHIWVGYEAFILAGADIGTGCVLGGRSLANRAYPNNCVLVGNPARVVKENVAWTRDPFTQNIFDDSALNDLYMQMTVK